MGVGYPVDMVVCVALGVDMFDCVYPSRTARFGTALVTSGTLHIKSAECAEDFSPLDPECGCRVCRNFTKAYLHSIEKEQLCGQLLTYHNIAYQLGLMRRMREAIIQGQFPAFVVQFMHQQFPSKNFPQWVVEALG